MINKLFAVSCIALTCGLLGGCTADTVDALTGESDNYGDITPQTRVKQLEDAGFKNPVFTELQGETYMFEVSYRSCQVTLRSSPPVFILRRVLRPSVYTDVPISTPRDLQKLPELASC